MYSGNMLVYYCETTKNTGEYLHITLKGVATELSRKQHQSGDDMRRLLNCKYILRRRIHSYKFLQNTVEKNNDGISRYNPRYIVEI